MDNWKDLIKNDLENYERRQLQLDRGNEPELSEGEKECWDKMQKLGLLLREIQEEIEDTINFHHRTPLSAKQLITFLHEIRTLTIRK